VFTGRDALAAASDRDSSSRSPLLFESTRDGVFAVGDVRAGSVKRVASAVGEGSMAVRLVHEYLDEVVGRDDVRAEPVSRRASSLAAV